MALHSSPQTEIGMQHISESVFVGLCRIIGTSREVAMKRDGGDVLDMVRKFHQLDKNICGMTTGSHREGFRLKGSDIDTLLWFQNHKVIFALDQAQNYNGNTQTMILSDCSESPPGYTLLVLLTPTNAKAVQLACIRVNDRYYISSSELRRVALLFKHHKFTEHGPCSTFRSGELEIEMDQAQGFSSDFWPPSAFSFMERCHLPWPGLHVINDIIKSGCHFVAKGHMLGHHEDKEWRISFSIAERKLVFSMNHCQFLTYGLLKLFLKEVINNGLSTEEQLLSSYHIKTAVFWVLQKDIFHDWFPQKLLEGFWICFKFILKCVYKGVCPNFFIPENNMFLSKIYGEAQNNLFLKLYGLYQKGIASLLHSPSVSPYIIQVLCNSMQHICTDERSLTFESEIRITPSHEIELSDSLYSPELFPCLKYLTILEQLLLKPLTQYQVSILRKLVTTVLQKMAFILHNEYLHKSKNRSKYKTDKISINMLKLVTKFGPVSEMLYISMYFYRTFRYQKVISTLQMAKVKLCMFCLSYFYEKVGETVMNLVMNIEDAEIQRWIRRLALIRAGEIKLDNEICYIKELLPEQMYGLKNTELEHTFDLAIPNFTLLYMLEFLSLRKIDPVKAQSSLSDLQSLVHQDQGEPPSAMKGDISWQILGICQQISENYQAALYSFLQSIGQDPESKIQMATLVRIHGILRIINPERFG